MLLVVAVVLGDGCKGLGWLESPAGVWPEYQKASLLSMLSPCTAGDEITRLMGALVLCQKRVVGLVVAGSRS